MKRFLALSALLSLVGCVHTDQVSANLQGQTPFGIIHMGNGIGYIVDVRTETCMLVYGNTGAALVSCAKLKKNVPEAAKYITWDVGTES